MLYASPWYKKILSYIMRNIKMYEKATIYIPFIYKNTLNSKKTLLI